MVLNNSWRMALRGVGLATLCLAAGYGYGHSQSRPMTAPPSPVEMAPIKTPKAAGTDSTAAPEAETPEAEDDGGDNEESPIVPSTAQDDAAAAQAVALEIDKRLLAGISDLRIVVRTGSDQNTFGEGLDETLTAGLIKAQIENQIRKSETPLRLSDNSENILEYDISVSGVPDKNGIKAFQIKSEMRLIRKAKLNVGDLGPQTVTAVLWSQGINADTVTFPRLKQQVTNNAAGDAHGLVSSRDEVVRDLNHKE